MQMYVGPTPAQAPVSMFVVGQTLLGLGSMPFQSGRKAGQRRWRCSCVRLQFFHDTAYKYLSESSKKPYDALPAVLKPQRLNQLYKGMAAVWYFTECADSEKQLERLKGPSGPDKFSGFGTIISYFEMSYGLLSAFQMTALPADISREEKEVFKVISQRLSDFLLSTQALRYFEMSTIIDYSGNYVQLLQNVLYTLENNTGRARGGIHRRVRRVSKAGRGVLPCLSLRAVHEDALGGGMESKEIGAV